MARDRICRARQYGSTDGAEPSQSRPSWIEGVDPSDPASVARAGRRPAVSAVETRRKARRRRADVFITMLPSGRRCAKSISAPPARSTRQSGHAVDRLLDHRRGNRARGRGRSGTEGPRDARRAGVGWRRRRTAATLTFMVGGGVRLSPARNRSCKKWARPSCTPAAPAPGRRPRSATT